MIFSAPNAGLKCRTGGYHCQPFARRNFQFTIQRPGWALEKLGEGTDYEAA